MSSRITLGVSGLDTETLINQLMQVERQPLTNLEARQTTLSARRQAWDALKSKLDSLSAQLSSLLSVGGFSQMKASVSDPAVVQANASASAPTGTYEIEVLSLAKSQVVISGSFSASDTALGIAGDVTLNGKTVSLTGTETLETLAARINGVEDIGVSAAVLQVKYGEFKLALTAEKQGTANRMSFGGEAGWTQLGVIDAGGVVNETRAASDACFAINGVSFVRDSNTVSDAIPGVTLNLLSAADPETGLGGNVRLTVGYDDQSVVTQVKAFITEYNSLIDTIKKYNSWDDEAKKGGLLFGDSLLQRLTRDIQSVLFRKVEGTPDGYQFASQIGISTGSVGSSRRDGKLTLDEAKLTKALAENRDAVATLFGAKAVSVGSEGQVSTENTGILSALRKTVRRYSAVDGYLPMRTSQIDSEEEALSRQIDSKKRSLDMRLSALQKQFSALEVLLSRLNTQGSWLASQLASLNSNGGN